MTEDQLRELFQELRAEPLPADSLARVRIGVSNRLKLRKSIGWRVLGFVCSAVALLALAGMALFFRPSEPVIDPPFVVQLPTVPDIVIPVSKPVRRHHIRKPEPPLHIRIETPDPDVVILLVGE